MAQLVKLEPGDVLVLANVGPDAVEHVLELCEDLRDVLGIEHVIAFTGDVDLSKLPAGSADAVAGR